MKIVLIVASFCLGSVMANRALAHGGQQMLATDKGKSLAKITFAAEELRMKKEMNASIAYIEKTMTVDKALTLLRQKNNISPDILKVVEHIAHNDTHQFLQRKDPNDDYGDTYSGAIAARTMLNTMLEEIATQSERDWNECESNFNSKCALLEQAATDIANYNAAAASAVQVIERNQAIISFQEKEIPRLKDELEHHKYDCAYKKFNLKQDEGVIAGDLIVMGEVLKKTECTATGAAGATGNAGAAGANPLLQTGQALLKCQCQDGHHVVHFHDESLRSRLAQIKSKSLQNRVLQSLQEMVDQAPDVRLGKEQTEFEEKFGRDQFNRPAVVNESVNHTLWPPTPPPSTFVPPNPCEGLKFNDDHVPNSVVGRCTYSNNPNCMKMRVRFMNIQGGIKDHLEYLRDELTENDRICKAAEKNLLRLIGQSEKSIEIAFADLAGGTKDWNDALNARKQTMTNHGQLTAEMKAERYECSKKWKTSKSEACALRKIRGELVKLRGVSYIPFFQDCDEGPWVKGDCSKSCGGGSLIKTRSVLVAPVQGRKCGWLKAVESCNAQACPVDCKMDQWAGWGDCSAECGGGIRTRHRRVITAPSNEGESCLLSTEEETCNAQSCDLNCELDEWSDWGWSKDGTQWPWHNGLENLERGLCSKKCGGGKMLRYRAEIKASTGQGTCAAEKSPERYELTPCTSESKAAHNMDNSSDPLLLPWFAQCAIPVGDVLDPIPCKSRLDVVLVLDSSNSLGEKGWEKTKEFASKFVKALLNPLADAQVSVIQYSGPASWDKFYNCADGASGNPEYNAEYRETECLVKVVQSFSNNREETLTNIENMPFMAKTTFTSLALETANAELMLGRKGVPAVVFCLTDGYPISPKQTHDAAKKLTSTGVRLMMVPVMGFGLDEEALQGMEEMVSEPLSDNLLKINDISVLGLMDTVSMLVSDTCTF